MNTQGSSHPSKSVGLLHPCRHNALLTIVSIASLGNLLRYSFVKAAITFRDCRPQINQTVLRKSPIIVMYILKLSSAPTPIAASHSPFVARKIVALEFRSASSTSIRRLSLSWSIIAIIVSTLSVQQLTVC